jgi:autotransporter family porin
VPIIRPEIPSFVMVPTMARQMGKATIGTFHERRGEQALLGGNPHPVQGVLPAAWGRAYGQWLEQGGSASLPRFPAFNLGQQFDGRIWGLQVGLDLLGWDPGDGHRNRWGLFYAHTQTTGDISGFVTPGGGVLPRPDTPSGHLRIDGDSFGGYWTHIGPTGWYLDAIAMYTWLDAYPSSIRNIGARVRGNSFAASLEAGYPWMIGATWTLEPQAQVIYQRLDLDPTADKFSAISYATDTAITGRLGLRLQGTMQAGSTVLQPYLRVNLWHDFSGSDTVLFNTTPFLVPFGSTTVEVGGGVVARISETFSLYASASYASSIGGDHRESVTGNVGLRIQW